MFFDHDELAPALLIFDDKGKLLREMLYSEFEAILENYVPAHEWAGRTLKASFVQMDSQYHFKRVVFFLLPFNRSGGVHEDWNVPLEQLASNALAGPDLGHGPVQIACASQCPIDHFKTSLWDPSLNKSTGHLAVIKKAISLNRLAIEFKGSDNPGYESDNIPKLHADNSHLNQANDSAIYRQQSAQLLEEQGLKLNMLEREHKLALKETKAESAARINEYRSHIDLLASVVEEEKARNKDLKQTIDGQANKIEGLREYFEHKLEQQQGQESEDALKIQERYRSEMEAKVAVVTSRFKEQLNAKDVETSYLKEKNQQLVDEIERLREENKTYLANSGDNILNKMVMKGISFVAYQSGAGHITLPQGEISRYMNNPVLYAAEMCDVSQDHYLAWLQHYQTPVCRHCDDSDVLCGADLDRVEQPAEFRVSIDDRCTHHRKNKPTLKLAGS